MSISKPKWRVEVVERGKSAHFRIKARNGLILAHSEDYLNKAHCRRIAQEITAHLDRPASRCVYREIKEY